MREPSEWGEPRDCQKDEPVRLTAEGEINALLSRREKLIEELEDVTKTLRDLIEPQTKWVRDPDLSEIQGAVRTWS